MKIIVKSRFYELRSVDPVNMKQEPMTGKPVGPGIFDAIQYNLRLFQWYCINFIKHTVAVNTNKISVNALELPSRFTMLPLEQLLELLFKITSMKTVKIAQLAMNYVKIISSAFYN